MLTIIGSVASGMGTGLMGQARSVVATRVPVDSSGMPSASLTTAEAETALEATDEALAIYDRGLTVMTMVRAQQSAVLRLFDLEVQFDELPSLSEELADVRRALTTLVASGNSASVVDATAAADAATSVDEGAEADASLDFDFEWNDGDANPLFTGAAQLSGAMTFTASARYDNLLLGLNQRVFDFGNGDLQDHVWLGQVLNTSDMAFEIVDNGVAYRVTATDAIVEGETALWTARVEENGLMTIFKDGVELASAMGVVVGGVDRVSNLAGESNFILDTDLSGAVHGYGIHNGALSDDQVGELAGLGDPWAP